MKKVALLLILFCISFGAFAQKELLVLNEQNQLAYYQVKNTPATSTANMATQTTAFFNKNYPGIKLDNTTASDSSLVGTGKLMLYKKSMLSGQEDGEVNYTLKIDFKNDKYRILLTNFTYTPYKRTRYGTFTPVNGISIPLDDAGKKLSTKQADTYLSQIGAYSAMLDKQLYNYLQNPTAVKDNKPALKKVNTTNW